MHKNIKFMRDRLLKFTQTFAERQWLSPDTPHNICRVERRNLSAQWWKSTIIKCRNNWKTQQNVQYGNYFNLNPDAMLLVNSRRRLTSVRALSLPLISRNTCFVIRTLCSANINPHKRKHEYLCCIMSHDGAHCRHHNLIHSTERNGWGNKIWK